MINDKHEIAYKSLHLALALVDLDKKTRYYGTDVPIFHSEIPVSEILKKLERKALVIKEIDDLNLSRYSLNLTEKGKKAHNNHMHYHAVLNSMVEDELKNASEQELAFLINFLSSLINRVKFFNENFDE